MTKLKALRRYCIGCAGEGWAAVRDCVITDCVLHPYRFGKIPQPKPALTVGKSIDEACLFCQGARVIGGNPVGRRTAAERARACDLDCCLHDFRYGQAKVKQGSSAPLEGSEACADDTLHAEVANGSQTAAGGDL